ncbi:TonB-dependent receptor [Pseudozobellia sp. WGM2]|uniref:SusC/RagA family TonB-linked outer membrane protein n=1 Tax=Pseudozobellia sp. WGM2 TaxID=2787625 RepID=UPI001FD86C97|nr:TonB-dependent receptor [Pseudozobellia sp. WGM2]
MPFIVFCFLVTGWVNAQNSVIISGEVTDENNIPLPGANIIEKGTSNGITTDLDGKFTIDIADKSNQLLVVSYIGFSTQEIEVDDKSYYTITLLPDSEALDEVVLVGYGTKKKEDVTNAISTVKADDLTRTTSTTTAGALAGRVQGISVRAADARPGRGASLEVRNMGNPLFVIDGIPYGGQTGNDWVQSSNVSGMDVFNTLNPEDIESVTILKDASAAIYGLRAANGVVLVTTKSGSKNKKTTVSINHYYGTQNLTRFPEMADASLYMRGLVEAAQNENRDPNSVLTPEELEKWQNGTEPGYQGYDYYKELMRKGIPQTQTTISVSGGSEKSSYYLSLGNLDQKALMKDFGYTRTNFQANLKADITKRLSIGSQISGKQEKTEDVGLPGGDGYFAAILGVFSNIPTVGPYANDNPNFPNHTRDFSRNPALFDRDIVGYKDNLNRTANINLFADYKFDFGLTASGKVSYNYTNNKFDGFQYTYDVYSYDAANDSYFPSAGVYGRWRYQTEREVVSRYAQFQLDYNKTFDKHKIGVTVGYEKSDYDKNYQAISTDPSNNYLPLLEYDRLNGLGDSWSYEARAGYIGRLNYNYDNRYILEILGRYDGSYLYPPGKRWGFFPGVSAAWRLSNEKFFNSATDIFSNVKIRGSIGQTGLEQGVGMFDYLGGYTFNSGNAVLDGSFTNGIRPRGLPVTNLSWVKNTNYNVGIDLGLFENKITLTTDVFKIIRSGTPAARYDVLLPSEVGYSLPNENLNKNGYYGIEGIISYKNSIKDFTYSASFNGTLSRYKSIETYKPRFGNSWDEYRSSSEDRWGGIWWGHQVIGRFQNEEQIKNHTVNIDGQNNRTLLPGDLIYKDVNGDGIINGMDERPIGYPDNWAPMISFGGNLALNWKGWGLNIDLAGGAMQSWFQDYELKNPYHAGGNSPAYLLNDRWHRSDPYDPDSEWISGYYPAIRSGNVGPNWRNSDFWLQNVKYLRLRNVELGYNFPSEFTDILKLSKARVYVNCSNLASIDNVKRYQIDPEIQARAAVVYPQQRTLIFGFNITF